MESYAYYDGRVAKRQDISIPLSNRSLFFGDAVYDAAVGCGGELFLIDQHIERLFSGAKRLGIPNRYTKDSLGRILKELISVSGLESYFVYFQLSRVSQSRVHSAMRGSSAELFATAEPFVLAEDRQISLITQEDLRYRLCDIKTVNLLPAVLAATKADEAGCDEAVFIRDGHVTECTRSNVSIINEGVLITHPANELILPGITRSRLLHFAKKAGIEVTERPFTTEELFAADEVLVTGTTKLCRRVCKIDGVRVGCRDEKTYYALSRPLIEEYLEFKKNSIGK